MSTVSLSGPESLAAYAGLNTAIPKVQLSDGPVAPGETFVVTVSATSGKITTAATASGSGSGTVTLSGSLGTIASALGLLDYVNATSGHDVITVTANDQSDGSGAVTTIDVNVRPANFTTVDDPRGVSGSAALGINNTGQIAGTFTNVSGFLYNAGSFSTIDDSFPGGPASTSPQGINDAGEIVGHAGRVSPGIHTLSREDVGFIDSGGSFQNFSYQPPAAIVPLSGSGSFTQLFFEGINSSDQIVGFYDTNTANDDPHTPTYAGFIYQNGTAQSIGPAGTQPFGINDAGQIVGQSGSHGFLHSNGVFTLIDDPLSSSTVARDINNNGEIVGYYKGLNDGGTHGFAYNPATGQWTTIDVPGATATFVYGENDLNQIVGSYVDGSNNSHGFVGTIPPPLPAVAGNVDEWLLFNGKWEVSAQPGSHPAGAHVAVVADFTGDGTSDVLWQNGTTGAVDLWKIYYGGWAGSVDLGTHPGTGWQIGGAGDLNHDGTSDVLWFNPGSGATDIWELANGQWAASVSPGSHPAGYQVAGIGDFNRDNTSDVLWFNSTTGDVDEWNIVNGHWAGSNGLGTHPGTGWQIAGIGDFNNDGTSDVFWFNPASGQTDIWEMSNGHWAASVSPGSHPTGWQVAAVADLDHDGFSDVLWFNPATHDAEEWIMSNGHWVTTIDLGAHPGSATIAGIGDFNGGGMSDILWHQFV